MTDNTCRGPSGQRYLREWQVLEESIYLEQFLVVSKGVDKVWARPEEEAVGDTLVRSAREPTENDGTICIPVLLQALNSWQNN